MDSMAMELAPIRCCAEDDHPSKRRRREHLPFQVISHVTASQKGSLDARKPLRKTGVTAPHELHQKDEKYGHINVDLGENLTLRYKIIRKMGEGTFGRVFECWDRDAHEVVAIKVIRNAQKYREAAMFEIEVLFNIGKDKKGARGCVQIKRWFDYQNHVCIVFEKLGPSLFDFLRANGYRPFFVDLVRDFGRQLLDSVAYMHNLGLIHTDLKPENALLVSSKIMQVADDKKPIKNEAHQLKCVPKSSRIKLIDFGSTTSYNKRSLSIVSTRHYRAPEVILGLGWGYPCDIWSIGCILVELCSGELLFETHENLEHLAMMERVLGPIPCHIIKKCTGEASKYFRHQRRLNWPEGAASKESLRAVQRLRQLKEIVIKHVDHYSALLVDLLEQMLKFDPSERVTAKEALGHQFFQSQSSR